ncbi:MULTISPECIES: substrate-binding domain-containing protein [unclassified Pantoea]|uniref:substrate-binding domain-containing protein n=1 Tax=unclassified Pantoea TaxID=2630326 RepID=UPI0001E08B53|nr:MULTISPECIES: substrate-binding domain-containing protein [unclassified Pantoea]EFM19665.1 periplasmic binding protein/LacI transcriptional regulator [Pantoea sp. aB]QNQ57536.1 substrate-binding domain-containing protein [Pantoea sp. MT58]
MTRPFKHDSPLSALPPVIGIVASQLLNPYQQKMLDEVTRQLNVRGAITVLLSADSEEALTALIRQATPLAMRGVILLPGNRITDTCNLPVLEIDAEPERQADARRAGEVTSELLLAEGHQRFGFMQSQPVESAQKQGYSTALQAAGRVLNAVLTSEADDRDGAYQAMMDYLKKTRAADRIQALFCESDLLAFGAIQAIRDFGQGAHIAVAGFGDSEEARSSTWHLTSWSPDIRQIMVNALDRWLGQHAVSSQVQGQLARRHSHFGKIAPGEMSACGCAFRH